MVTDPISKKIPVIEMFGPTIQGEGALIGQQTFFIRTGLCDYRCRMCDSLHAVIPQMVKENAAWMTQREILEAVIAEAGHCNHVTISGGNPAMHDLYYLVTELAARGFKTAVETQGTIWNAWMHHVSDLTISPKGPGMGEIFRPEVFKNFVSHAINNPGLNIKVPVFSQLDLEFLVEVTSILRDQWPNRKIPVYASLGNPYPPAYDLKQFGINAEFGSREETPDKDNLILGLLKSYEILAEDILNDPRLSMVRFTPQLHVLAWGNELSR